MCLHVILLLYLIGQPLHITSSDSIQIVQSNFTTTEDSGMYSCSVGSPAGSSTRFFRIHVISKFSSYLRKGENITDANPTSD